MEQLKMEKTGRRVRGNREKEGKVGKRKREKRGELRKDVGMRLLREGKTGRGGGGGG